MEIFVNACVLVTTVFAFAYLGYVLLCPDKF